MSLNYALLNGASGLRTTQTAINTVSHNLANSETLGYSRQRVSMSAQPGAYGATSKGGRGATVSQISRVSDRFVTAQVRRDRNLLGFFTSRENALYALDSMYSEDIAPSISGGLDGFFNSVRDLTRDPAGRGARTQMIGGGDNMAEVFHRTHADLRRLQIDLDKDVVGRVQEINDLITYIAQLNTEVVAAGTSSMDFEDKRDEAVARLTELIPITTVPQDSGSVHIQLDGVGTIVQDGLHATMQALPDPAERRSVLVEFTGIGGIDRRDITAKIDRGELGGLLTLRDDTVQGLLNDINTLALEFAEAVNAQHESGFDLNGNRGQAFFTFDDPAGDPAANIRVNAAIVANTDLVAVSSSALLDPVTGAVVGGVPGDAHNGIALSNLQYMTRSVIAGVASGSSYTGSIAVGGVYNASIGSTAITVTAINAGGPGAATFRIDGLPASVLAAGSEDNGGVGYSLAQLNAILNPTGVNLNMEENGSAFAAGDTINVDFFSRTSTFNRKIAETIQHVGEVAQTNYEQTEIHMTRLTASEKLKESVVGVSIDEELLDLTRFEKQFAANGKVIQTVNDLMDSVLALVG